MPEVVTAVTALPDPVTALFAGRCNQDDEALEPKNPLKDVGSDLRPLGAVVTAVTPVTALPKAQFAALAGVSLVAIQKAIVKKRIDAETFIPESGFQKGKTLYNVILESGFHVYPQARIRYEAKQAAAREEARRAEIQAAQTAARTKVLANGPLTASALALARAWHCQRFERFQRESGENRSRALVLYIQAFEQGALGEIPSVAEPVAKLSERTLLRWVAAWKDGGAAALEPAYKSSALPVLDRNPEMGHFAVGLLLETPDVSSATIHEMLEAHFGKEETPSEAAVTRYLTRWKKENQAQWELRLNPDKYRSKYLPAQGSLSEDVEGLNDLWEADATKVDLIFSDDPRRWTLCAMVDVYSDRRAFLLVESAGARDQIHLLRNCIVAWGLPARLKTDNGKDYTAKLTNAALTRLEIEHILCPPFRGDRKPHVERGFRLFLHDLVPALPGFCGHDVAQAQDIRARRSFAERLLKKGKDEKPVEAGITRAAFETFLGEWLAADELRVRGKNSHIAGKCPKQIVDEWASEPLNRVHRIDPAVLDYVLLPGISRKVAKAGIFHNGHTYVCPFPISTGAQVEVREPEDMGRLLVFQGERFLGIAENAELTGISKQEVAVVQQIHYNARTKHLREATRELRRGVNMDEAVQATLDYRRRGSSPTEVLQHADTVQSLAVSEALKAQAADQAATARHRKPLPEKRPLEIQADTLAQIKQDLAQKTEDALGLEGHGRYLRMAASAAAGLDAHWL